jgi:DNA-binding NarL/FixJ family response regulator
MMSDVELSILLVEDDAMVTGWVRMALEGSSIRLAGVAASAAEALALVERRHVDLLLVDFRLPDGRGTELVRDLRRKGCAIPALLMTANEERGFNAAAREAGAQGTVLKTGSADELVEALRRVHGGETAYDLRHPQRPTGRAALSPREREVITLVAAGSTNQQIAEELGVGSETVKTLLSRTFAKLGVRRRAEAVSAAHDLGLL